MEFEKACCEVDFILDNLDAEYKQNIPDDMINFFKFNKDMFYKVNIDISKPLDEQNLMEETKAFLYILKEDYFKNYRYNVLNEEKELEMFTYTENDGAESSNNKMVVYNNNPIINFIRKIKLFFKHN